MVATPPPPAELTEPLDFPSESWEAAEEDALLLSEGVGLWPRCPLPNRGLEENKAKRISYTVYLCGARTDFVQRTAALTTREKIFIREIQYKCKSDLKSANTRLVPTSHPEVHSHSHSQSKGEEN